MAWPLTYLNSSNFQGKSKVNHTNTIYTLWTVQRKQNTRNHNKENKSKTENIRKSNIIYDSAKKTENTRNHNKINKSKTKRKKIEIICKRTHDLQQPLFSLNMMVDLRGIIQRSKRVNNGQENPAILVPPTLPGARIGKSPNNPHFIETKKKKKKKPTLHRSLWNFVTPRSSLSMYRSNQ